MSEEPPKRRGWIGAVVAGVAVLGGVAGVIYLDESTPEPGAPPSPPPAPTVTPAPSVAPAAKARVSLPPPPEVERPSRPDKPHPAPLTPMLRRDMNYFVQDIVKAARDNCIVPWLDEFNEPTQAEFVFDTVLYDGEMYDVGIRSLDLELPERVRGCIADEAWAVDPPQIDLEGEVRLQRATTLRNQRE